MTTTLKILYETPVDEAVSLALQAAPTHNRNLTEDFPFFSGGYLFAKDLAVSTRSTIIRFLGNEIIRDFDRFSNTLTRCAWPTFCESQSLQLQFMSPIENIDIRPAIDMMLTGPDTLSKDHMIILDSDGYIMFGTSTWLALMMTDPFACRDVFRLHIPLAHLFPVVLAFEKTD